MREGLIDGFLDSNFLYIFRYKLFMHFIYQINYPTAQILCKDSVNLVEFDEPITEDFNNVTCSKCLTFAAEKYIVAVDKNQYVTFFDDFRGDYYIGGDDNHVINSRYDAFIFTISGAEKAVKELRKDHKNVIVYKVTYQPVEIVPSH